MNSECPDLVRVQRIDDLEPLICQVHQSTVNCIVASELSDSLDLDGLCLIPTRTVRCFDHSFEKADFYRAALGAWSYDGSCGGLVDELACSLASDLRLFADRGYTVAISMELDDPDVCYVGSVQMVSDTRLALDRISSSGRPIKEPFVVDISSITQVEICTRYLTAVAHAARALASPKSP